MAEHCYNQYLKGEKMQKRLKKLQCFINKLSKSADDFDDQAKNQNDMTLLAKSNSFFGGGGGCVEIRRNK